MISHMLKNKKESKNISEKMDLLAKNLKEKRTLKQRILPNIIPVFTLSIGILFTVFLSFIFKPYFSDVSINDKSIEGFIFFVFILLSLLLPLLFFAGIQNIIIAKLHKKRAKSGIFKTIYNKLSYYCYGNNTLFIDKKYIEKEINDLINGLTKKEKEYINNQIIADSSNPLSFSQFNINTINKYINNPENEDTIYENKEFFIELLNQMIDSGGECHEKIVKNLLLKIHTLKTENNKITVSKDKIFVKNI